MDILKHEGKGAIFLRQFFYFFLKTVQKGRKAQKQSFKDVDQGFLEISKEIKKIASLGKNVGNFLEKYIWMSSSVVKLEGSLQLYQ